MASKRRRRDKETGRRAASDRLAAAVQRATARAEAAPERAVPEGVRPHVYHHVTLVRLPDGTQRGVIHSEESSGSSDDSWMNVDLEKELTITEENIRQYTDPIEPLFNEDELLTDWEDHWADNTEEWIWHEATSAEERAMFRDAEILASVST